MTEQVRQTSGRPTPIQSFIFLLFSSTLWLAFISLITLVWLEYLGGYTLLLGVDHKGEGKFQLHKTNYYGHPLQDDPYKVFSVQHLHPFYLFSQPYTSDGIAEANRFNQVVSLTTSGFRASFRNHVGRKGVVLGGSAAFGVGASSDEGTLPSALNKLQSDYEFINYGQQSWNSHQEMVAYTKIPFKTDYVIAFSGSNDFIIALRYCRKGYQFPAGSPESFEYLAGYFDDIRGQPLKKQMSSRLFPETLRKISRLMRKKKNEETGTSSRHSRDCRATVLNAAEAFIANQRVVADLAKVRGARYLLTLQPHTGFLVQSGRTDKAELRQSFYQHVMLSEFCHVERCVDLSRTFADVKPLRIEDTPDAPSKAIFVDRVHLTDHGYASVAELLVSEIR